MLGVVLEMMIILVKRGCWRWWCNGCNDCHDGSDSDDCGGKVDTLLMMVAVMIVMAILMWRWKRMAMMVMPRQRC